MKKMLVFLLLLHSSLFATEYVVYFDGREISVPEDPTTISHEWQSDWGSSSMHSEAIEYFNPYLNLLLMDGTLIPTISLDVDFKLHLRFYEWCEYPLIVNDDGYVLFAVSPELAARGYWGVRCYVDFVYFGVGPGLGHYYVLYLVPQE